MKKPNGIEPDSAESAFLVQAIELVEKNLDVNGYSVEQLSRDLCMERTGLYRKLVTLLRPVPQPLYPQHPPPTSSATTCRRQTERNRNSGAYRLQQFQLPKQMFSRNVWMPSLGIYGESEEINLIVVCFNIAIVRKTSFHPTFAVS